MENPGDRANGPGAWPTPRKGADMLDSTHPEPITPPGGSAANGIPLQPDDPRHGTINAYGTYGCRCDRCRAAAAAGNQNRADKARKLIAAAKDRPCADCGGTFPLVCMDFDHRDPAAKLYTISNGLQRSHASLIAEIAKCDVICSNCHRIRTAGQHAAGMLSSGRPRKATGQPARRNRAKR